MNLNESEEFSSSINWKYLTFPFSNVKYVVFPIVNLYQLYFMVKLLVKYKTQLQPVHIFELNSMGDLLGSTITKMIINYDPYVCGNWIYNSDFIHFINFLCRSEYMYINGNKNFFNPTRRGLWNWHRVGGAYKAPPCKNLFRDHFGPIFA